MKAKLNICLTISLVIGVAYAIYLVTYFTGANVSAAGNGSAQAAGAALATALVMPKPGSVRVPSRSTALVMPHAICVFCAVLFNALGLFLRKSGFALVGAILYAVSMVLFFPYFFFVIVEMILSFVGFAQLRKAQSA